MGIASMDFRMKIFFKAHIVPLFRMHSRKLCAGTLLRIVFAAVIVLGTCVTYNAGIHID